MALSFLYRLVQMKDAADAAHGLRASSEKQKTHRDEERVLG